MLFIGIQRNVSKMLYSDMSVYYYKETQNWVKYVQG